MRKIHKRIIISLMACIGIISSVAAAKLYMEPSKIEEKIIVNKVIEYAKFDYKAKVLPSTLYPSGGLISPNSSMFTNITDSVNIHINFNITSLDKVDVKGSKKVLLQIISEDTWQKDIALSQQQAINLNGKTNNIFNNNFSINIKDILSFIEKVEEDTDVRSGKYTIKIKPVVQGNIIYNNKQFPISINPEIAFDLSGRILKLRTDEGKLPLQTSNQEFKNEIVLENSRSIVPEFDMLNISMSIKTAKYIFLVTALLGVLPAVTMGLKKLLLYKKAMTEAEIIDKKYGSYLISIPEKLEDDNRSVIKLQNFKALITISEQKDQTILRYNMPSEGVVNYYLLDNSEIYKYSADNKSLKEIHFSAGLISNLWKWHVNG